MVHLRVRFLFQRVERAVDTSGIERAGLNINLLVDVQDVGGSSTERAPRGGDLFLRDDHLLYAELVREHAGMRGTRTAECEEHEVPRIEPLFDGHLANDVRHLELGDPGDAGCGLH